MSNQLNFLSPRERVLYLKSVPFLRDLTSQALFPLADVARERTFKPGERLIDPEYPVPAAQVLVDGQVDLYWDGSKVREVKPPHTIGFLGLMARVERGIEAIATEPTQTLEISAADLFRVYERNFDLFYSTVGRMVDEVIDRRGGYPGDPKNPPKAEVGTAKDEQLSFVGRLMSYRRASLFGDVNLDAVAALVRQQEERRYTAGEVIWRKGEFPNFNLFMVRGIAVAEPAENLPAMEVGSDYTLGLGVFGRRPRAYTLTAKTDVIGMATDSEVYASIFEDHFDIGLSVATSLARLLVSVRGSAVMDPPDLPFSDRAVSEIYAADAPRTVM